jgi:hypothetical protein
MISVIDKPCSPREYNGLPGIMEADAAIKNAHEALDKLVDAGSAAVRSSLFAHGEVGAFLLHKHWEVPDGECMVEHPGTHPSGNPALITSAQRFPGSSAIAPTRFKVDPQSGQLMALEFSSDEFAVAVWRALLDYPDFLEGISRLVGDSGLADQVGIATFARAAVPMVQGEEMVEENWNNQSVLSAQVLVDDEEKVVVPTGWSFVSDKEEDVLASTCIAYCMLFAGSHCVHHYNRPDVIKEERRISSPPVCTLHD